MKKNTIVKLMLTIAFMHILVACNAQQRPTYIDTISAGYIRMLTQTLSLNAAQQKRITHAFKFRHHELQRISIMNVDSTNKRNNLKQTHMNYEKVIQSVLDSSQYKKYVDLNNDRIRVLQNRAKSKSIKVSS